MGSVIFTKPELAALAALRARFLDGSNAGGGYWKSETELALYDASFGERIGWKWDAVLGELKARGWRPSSRHAVDWGCGSGIAGRRVLGEWDHFESLTLADVSPLAMRFAEARARENFPALRVRMKADAAEAVAGSLLLVSHVLNETDDDSAHQLIAAARRASEIIWVEAGTHADSRRLISVREKLLGEFDIIAPCTHAARCGMLAPENAAHWCHHFATVPSEASRDARWAQFGRELGIDMRSLPYSFLVLARRGAQTERTRGFSRIIGRPIEEKGRFDVLSCGEDGVEELVLQKRDAPALSKQFHKGRADAVQRWTREGKRITGAEPLGG
ncbi:MAG: small ribosomal subunit Rsm22 family protein [Chthoniobacteraceae bacterium]